LPLNVRIVTTLVAPAGFSQIVEAGEPNAFAAKEILRHFVSEPCAKRGPNLGATHSICIASEPIRVAQPPWSSHNPRPFYSEAAFEPGSDWLTASAQINLNAFAKSLTGPSSINRRFIGGHTYARLDDGANVRPSQRRAVAVKDYSAAAGLDASRLTAHDSGETMHRTSSLLDAANRRFETALVD
jgi:hypothetical protein